MCACVCGSDGAQMHGYVPNSVYRTRTQYRMQRYPTFSAHGQQPHRVPVSGSVLRNLNHPCSAAVGSHHDEHCTYQASSSHPLTTISSSSDGFHLKDGVAKTPSSDYIEVSSTSNRSNFVNDQSRYISSCQSNTATPQFVSESCNFYETNHRSSSNFYSMSSHYSMRSRLTVPAPAAVDPQQPIPSSTITTVTSHSVTAVQHRQNLIEISKPFESADVLRYSEKLRRQRLNDSTATPAEIS